MKVVVIILALLAFIACLIIGIQAGSHSLQLPSAQPAGTTALPPGSGQRIVVLILADDLQAAKPALANLGLILYIPTQPQITYIPLYPTAQLQDKIRAAGLANAFALNSDGSLNSGFVGALENYHFSWNGYVLTDAYGAAHFYKFLGVQVDLQEGSSNPQEVMEEICRKASDLPAEANWVTTFSDLMPQHLHTNLGIELLLTDWQSLKQIGEPFSCQVASH